MAAYMLTSARAHFDPQSPLPTLTRPYPHPAPLLLPLGGQRPVLQGPARGQGPLCDQAAPRCATLTCCMALVARPGRPATCPWRAGPLWQRTRQALRGAGFERGSPTSHASRACRVGRVGRGRRVIKVCGRHGGVPGGAARKEQNAGQAQQPRPHPTFRHVTPRSLPVLHR